MSSIPRTTRSQPQLDTPPTVPWATFYATQARQNRQGQHKLFVGPTQSGKTVLCRLIADLRSAVVVLGTKAVDTSLIDYERDGYARIDSWPPSRQQIRKSAERNQGKVRFLLWPEIKTRADLRSDRVKRRFAELFDDVFIEGRWTVVVDETMWCCSKRGLDLDSVISSMAFGSASNKVSMYFVMQRPSDMSRIIWSSVSDAYIFHGGIRDDVRELASLGTHDPKAVSQTIARLQGHQFLYLPTRAQGEWAVSKAEIG